ncbi:MAG: proline--tRNA ligase [Caldibacillus sp.]
MKQSQLFIPTLKETPKDAEIISHKMLLRAGYIRQVASGIYAFLPLAKKVLNKIEQIVREEMNAIGAVEIFMPALQPAELWEESGRWHTYGPELMRLSDRHERPFVLGPTHEEVITSLLRNEVRSYKRLPLTMYQIQTKFRDEVRPRFGLLRGREFVMKDAYSFHADEASLDEMYQKMVSAYTKIFTRLGLDFRVVHADSGAIGGDSSHEFMVIADSGEDIIAYSDASDYAANIEKAEVVTTYVRPDEPLRELKKVDTGEHRTIEAVSQFLNIEPQRFIKSILFVVDDEFVLALVRGDHEVNEVKLKNLFNAQSVELATPEQTKEVLGASIGYIGPIDAKVKIVADRAVEYMVNAVCGANEEHLHYLNANPGRDFQVDRYADLRFIQEGDPSPDGKGTIKFARGIEVGHVFKLGTKYSEAMGATFLDENGKEKPIIMGCYGIGITRLLAAVAEQKADEYGLIWPEEITPYELHIIVVNRKDPLQWEKALELYETLTARGFDVLLDDRDERAGVKFADSDLIGIPYRVIVGKRIQEGVIEVKDRRTGESKEIVLEELLEKHRKIFKRF